MCSDSCLSLALHENEYIGVLMAGFNGQRRPIEATVLTVVIFRACIFPVTATCNPSPSRFFDLC